MIESTRFRLLALALFFMLYAAPALITDLVEPVPYYPPVMEYDDDNLKWKQLVC